MIDENNLYKKTYSHLGTALRRRSESSIQIEFANYHASWLPLLESLGSEMGAYCRVGAICDEHYFEAEGNQLFGWTYPDDILLAFTRDVQSLSPTQRHCDSNKLSFITVMKGKEIHKVITWHPEPTKAHSSSTGKSG